LRFRKDGLGGAGAKPTKKEKEKLNKETKKEINTLNASLTGAYMVILVVIWRMN
jgi:hypothetical protein